MRSHLPAALCSLALFAPSTYAAPRQYMVDVSGSQEYTVVFGGSVFVVVHTLRVHGTIDAETTTGELMTSNLLFTHNAGNEVLLPALPQVVGSPSQYHWLATSTELRFFSDAPSLFWTVSEVYPPYGLRFVNQYSIGPAASGFLSQRLYYLSETGYSMDSEDISAQSPAASGILVGTAVVPEPASYAMAILGFATVGAFRRRSRSAV